MPDALLLAAAGSGQLETADQVEAQVRRMLQDARAERGLASFHMQWLELRLTTVQKDTTVYPLWGPALRRSMEAEVGALAADVFQHADGKLETLLTTPTAFVSGALGWLYEVPDPAGQAIERRALSPRKRAGLLTSAAFLARHGNTHESHPVRRGKLIFERLLCGDGAPPPPNIPQIKPPGPDLSTRERYAQHAQDSFCASCHEDFDAFGFAFEHYDGLGVYRTQDGRKPVDASGIVTFKDGKSHGFKDAVELARLLARSEDVRHCVTLQWARYALGRRETESDRPALASIYRDFERSDFDLRELVVAIARNPLFRTPLPQENR
jgi:hypothetical protein